MTTTVVNRRRLEFDVYVGRGSPWGNPYWIGLDGNKAEVIALYREYLLTSPELLDRIGELRGKRLGCYCKPAACHGDVLAALADGTLQCMHPSEPDGPLAIVHYCVAYLDHDGDHDYVRTPRPVSVLEMANEQMRRKRKR